MDNKPELEKEQEAEMAKIEAFRKALDMAYEAIDDEYPALDR